MGGKREWPTDWSARILLSMVDGGAVVRVKGMMDVPVAMALRKLLTEAVDWRPGAIRLQLDIPLNGAELLAQILRDAQARFLAQGRKLVVATPNPAVVQLLAGANVTAELQPATG